MTTSNQNAAAYFVERHRIGHLSEKTAFLEADGACRSLTYGALAEQSDRMIGLYQRHGVRREDRAAVLVTDQIEYPIIFWGSLKAGVIPVLLNTLLSASVYQAILEDCRARVLFVSEALLPAIEPILAQNEHLERVFVIGTPHPDGLDFTAELEQSHPGEMIATSADETAFWLYSSGSTGRPKGVCHVHSSLKDTADTYGAKVLGIQESDLVYSVAKIFFAYGLGNAMTFPMSVGATTILYAGRPTPDSCIDLIGRLRPTLFCGVPTLYAALCAKLDEQDVPDDARLRVCISAGEALPADVGRRWKAQWGVDILDGVGSTEMLHIFLSNAPDDVVYGTSGTAVPGYDVRLVDEHDAAVEPGGVGELLVRGGSAASCYWNQREKSRQTFEGEWTRTGDKYELAADGRFVFCGRTDDMFKVSGIWVAPFEIEQALSNHEAVLEAAVVASQDDEGLMKPKAFVVLRPGIGSDSLDTALKEHVKEQIGKWKYPRWVTFVDDLPKTATGKIQRFKLRETVE